MNCTLDLTQIDESAHERSLVNLLSVLNVGESFLLVNHEDPKPLLERSGAFDLEGVSVEYLSKKPGEWSLRITRNVMPRKEGSGGCCGCCGG